MVVVRSLACVLPRTVQRLGLTVACTAVALVATGGTAAPTTAPQASIGSSGTAMPNGICTADTPSCTAATARGQAVFGTSDTTLAVGPLFDGMTLADSQRVAIAAVRSRFLAEARVKLDSLRDAMSSLQGTGTSDSVATAADTALVATLRSELASLLTAERSAMRDLLTSAQQQAYDANVAADVARAAGADQ